MAVVLRVKQALSGQVALQMFAYLFLYGFLLPNAKCQVLSKVHLPQFHGIRAKKILRVHTQRICQLNQAG